MKSNLIKRITVRLNTVDFKLFKKLAKKNKRRIAWELRILIKKGIKNV